MKTIFSNSTEGSHRSFTARSYFCVLDIYIDILDLYNSFLLYIFM